MCYRIALQQSEGRFSVSVPGLPGCWYQGASEADAVESIKDAIKSTVVDDQLRGTQIREVEVIL